MKTVKCTFEGKAYELPANNSLWISDSETKIDPKVIELLRNRPRVGKDSKGAPIIEDDNGKRITLGAASLRRDDEKLGSGSGSCPVKFAQEVVNLKTTKLSQECVDFFKNIVEQSKRGDKTLIAQLMARGFSEEEARSIAGGKKA